MSYACCSSCQRCKDGQPSYCDSFSPLNTGGKPDLFRGASNTEVGGSFFGQSSFSSLSAVRECSVVNVSGIIKSEEELKLFAPLGCGFQTGAGTVTDLAGTTDKDTVAIFGLGGVGLAAVMVSASLMPATRHPADNSIKGAKVKGAKTIIGVDRIASRMELAKSLGATHVINTSDADLDLVQEIRDMTQGAGTSVTVDTTGNVNLITKGLEMTTKGGQMILVGLMPLDAELKVHLISHLSVRDARFSSVTDADIVHSTRCRSRCAVALRGVLHTARYLPFSSLKDLQQRLTRKQYVPQMIEWYRESSFPIDKLVKYYPVCTPFTFQQRRRRPEHVCSNVRAG